MQVKMGGSCLTYSQALQHLLQVSRLKILSLIPVQFSWDPEAAEVVGMEFWRHLPLWMLLFRDGVKLQPPG
jgi:hypothetical protein